MGFFGYASANFYSSEVKLVGFTYEQADSPTLILKSDSSLLVNRKPFFIPDFAQHFTATPCLVFRLCKVGKSISQQFAPRYWDSFTFGLNIKAKDLLQQAHQTGDAWTAAIAFDYSLVVGKMLDKELFKDVVFDLQIGAEKQRFTMQDWALTAEETIEKVSHLMTVRQGDLLFMDNKRYVYDLQQNTNCKVTYNDEEILFCAIK